MGWVAETQLPTRHRIRWRQAEKLGAGRTGRRHHAPRGVAGQEAPHGTFQRQFITQAPPFRAVHIFDEDRNNAGLGTRKPFCRGTRHARCHRVRNAVFLTGARRQHKDRSAGGIAGHSQMRLWPKLLAEPAGKGIRLRARQHQRVKLQHRIGAAILALFRGQHRHDAALQFHCLVGARKPIR